MTTGRFKNDKYYRAIASALWYNVGLEPIKGIFEKLEALPNGSILSFRDVDEGWYNNSELNTYWTIFVELFGDYGTSPRSGWLNKTKECLEFFKDLCEDLKEEEQ